MTLPSQDEEPAAALSKKLAELEIMVPESEKAEDSAVEDCKTPTGKEYRIPEVQTCPPAPRRRPRDLTALIDAEIQVKIGEIKESYAQIDRDIEELCRSLKRR